MRSTRSASPRSTLGSISEAEDAAPALAAIRAGARGSLPPAAARGRDDRSRSSEARGVSIQAFRELARAAERDVVAALCLVGLDAETLASVAARPCCAEQAIVAAQDVPGRRIGPLVQRPRLPQRARRLVALSPPRCGGELGRNVVVEDVVRAGGLVAGVRPPVLEALAGATGSSPATRIKRSTGTRAQTSGAVNPPSEWPTTTTCRAPATASATHRAYAHQPADSWSPREIDRDGVVSALAQLGVDQVPVPRAPSSTVDQCEDRHGCAG